MSDRTNEIIYIDGVRVDEFEIDYFANSHMHRVKIWINPLDQMELTDTLSMAYAGNHSLPMTINDDPGRAHLIDMSATPIFGYMFTLMWNAEINKGQDHESH